MGKIKKFDGFKEEDYLKAKEIVKNYEKTKSDSLKNKICNSIINTHKVIFEFYPELNILPVYAWGRYYKYELAGDDFEVYLNEYGYSTFYRLGIEEDIQWDLLNQITKEHNNPGGNLWVGKWGDYLPIRDEVVEAFNFDGRGGKCLLIFREGNGFIVKDVDCGSPE